MSAWLVSKKHIDVLVKAIVREGITVNGIPRPNHLSIVGKYETAIGRMLWRENMLSLAARYSDAIDEKALASYRYVEPTNYDSSVAAIVKAAHCYDYQLCEHDGWEASEARRLTRELVWSCVVKLPGWDAAPWGIDDETPKRAAKR